VVGVSARLHPPASTTQSAVEVLSKHNGEKSPGRNRVQIVLAPFRYRPALSRASPRPRAPPLRAVQYAACSVTAQARGDGESLRSALAALQTALGTASGTRVVHIVLVDRRTAVHALEEWEIRRHPGWFKRGEAGAVR
jgi:hypothetical protein